MGCTTCSTKSDGAPSGCQNNGTCGTSGCNKLNVYNWLADMELPFGQKPYNIVEVRFKGSRKEFFKNPEPIILKAGDIIAVEGNPGHDIGVVSMAGELVRFQLKKKGLSETSEEIKIFYRLARPADIEKWESSKKSENPTMHRARKIALDLKLNMKLSDVEYQGDGKKATFYYTAENRVDFRELIKKLAEEFKVRIEMRQIGMRQEASRLGGIGSCGRELCCSTWLTDFKAVSTGAARYQNLSLNPLKLAGQCGKLKCCLNYELDSYMDALQDIPEPSIKLETQNGRGFHRKTDIFKRLMWYAFQENQKNGETHESDNSDKWVLLTVDRVKEVIEQNKNNIKPQDLKSYEEKNAPVEKKLDYTDVVGQDSLTRMDNNKKKKKKKKRPGGSNQSNQNTDRPNPSGQNTSRPDQGKPNVDSQNSNRPKQSSQNQARPNQSSQNPTKPDQSRPNHDRQNSGGPNQSKQQNQPERNQSGQNPPEQNPNSPNPATQPSGRPPRKPAK